MRTLQRMAVAVTAFTSLLGISVLVTPAAGATVYSSCTISRCSAARSADSIWDSKNYPGSRGWYDWPTGQCNFAGGTYKNLEAELPNGHSYREFDVYPRSCGASRDAYRIVVDLTVGVTYFSPDHYANFYRL